MKKKIPKTIVTLLLLLCCSNFIYAQTNPVAQSLPYNQDFNSLASSNTGYPDGFQGWNLADYPSSTYSTTTAKADKTLTASSTASTTSGNIHNYNQKIGFLNTGSIDLSLCLAINTLNKSGIKVEYDAMVIRNPYNAGTNTRINEMVLQYRIGITGSFVTINETAYASETTAQSTGTTGLNPKTINTILPSVCNNQNVVQLRWVTKQNSGSGSRPSFAIDNVKIVNDILPPTHTDTYPSISNITGNSFDFAVNLNEKATSFYVLLNNTDSAPTSEQIKLGFNATNNPALQSGSLDVIDALNSFSKSITGLDLSTTYTLYIASEDLYGNLQTTPNTLIVKTLSTQIPNITVSKNNINFNLTEKGFDSNIISYRLNAENLVDGITIVTGSNFSVSKTESGSYSTNINFDLSDFNGGNSVMIYAKFNPNTFGSFTGEIMHSTPNASNKKINLSGIGINPYYQDFNDLSVLSNSGWTSYSASGNQLQWASTTTRYNSAPAAVIMNGYAETGASNDWLISPKLHLNTFGGFPVLSFQSRKYYTGPGLKLMISKNYDGLSNPETATWTELDGKFPTETGVFTLSDNIDLSSYKSSETYLAWVYESTNSGTNYNAEWLIDDVAITDKTTFLEGNPKLQFGEIAINNLSKSQSFVFKSGGFGAVTLNAPLHFQISKDNISFQNSISLSSTEVLNGAIIYVQFAPTQKLLTITGAITVLGTGLNQQIGSLTGSSILKTDTFDIVSYNLEFFASDVIGTSGVEFGPIDDDLQIENVATVMNQLDADVYAVQEVSNDDALDVLISKISINGKTFDKAISPTWSYSFQALDPQFPPQKLAVLYNTKTTTVKKTKVLFQKLFDDIRSKSTSLPNYPGGSSASFFSSGRLPYLVELQTNIGGVKKDLTIIDLHARANSGTDISRYNMRKYDIDLLKDSLDVYYPKNNIILLGDFNDDVDTSVIARNDSSYKKFVDDTVNYNPLTLSISQQGAFSYLSSNGFLDHIIISNELTKDYISNSIMVFDPRTIITNYVSSTSDHGPVTARFTITNQAPTVVKTLSDSNIDKSKNISLDLNTFFDDIDSYPLTYQTVSSNTNIATTMLTNQSLVINAIDAGETIITISANDEQNNRVSFSFKVMVINQLGVFNIDIQKTIKVKTYPNPVTDFMNISVLEDINSPLSLNIYDLNGKVIYQQKAINSKFLIELSSLSKGVYIYTLTQNKKVIFRDKIIKK